MPIYRFMLVEQEYPVKSWVTGRPTKKYGRLPWKDLFEPAIKLCETGSSVTKYLEKVFKSLEYFILKEPTLRVFTDPKTNKTYQGGDRIKRPASAKTLRELANAKNPVELFYNGSIAENLIREIQMAGGILTREDFSSYKVSWSKPAELKLVNRTVYSAPALGSGPLLLFMLNVLQGFASIDDEKVLSQRIVETIKWSIAKKTELADPAFEDIREVMNQLTSEDYANFIRKTIEDNRTYNDPRHYGINVINKEDHGTAHISVMAPDGSAVSVTSSINRLLGAKFRSTSTGVIINNQMDDFAGRGMTNSFGLPPATKNYIKPYKRPTRSMAPTVVVDADGNVELVIGASGGSKLISAIATIMVFDFWKNYDIKEATDAYRLHARFFPMEIQNESDFPSDILNFLQEIGHKTRAFSKIGASVTAIAHS